MFAIPLLPPWIRFCFLRWVHCLPISSPYSEYADLLAHAWLPVLISLLRLLTSWYFYRPQRSWGKVMFLHVSVILFTGGLPQCMLGYTALERTLPPPRRRPLPGRHLPTVSSTCWEIWATSGWYASYWNAYLLFLYVHNTQ